MLRLKVPENISLEWQLWQGFGKAELRITSISLAIAISCAAFYVHSFKNTLAPLIAVAGVLLATAFTIALVQKVAYNLSILKFIAIHVLYRKEQQHFYFKEKEEFRLYVEQEATK